MSSSNDTGFNAEEKAAVKQALAEKRKRGKQTPEQDEEDCLAAIRALPDSDRELAEWIHRIALEVAPELCPKTFYGMPAYAKNGKNVLFFQGGGKFKTRYCTLGFTDSANLDHGVIWPTSFAIVGKKPDAETAIRELIRRATSS